MNAFTSKTSSRFDPSQRQTKAKTLLVANSNIRQPDSFAYGEGKPALRLAVKRLIDIVISANALLVLAPLFLAIALLIKLDDGGPVFFRQIRWGLNGRKINVFKFRSMRAEACDP
ncbi:sugar transferase, partial [Rhizobium phaseoli]